MKKLLDHTRFTDYENLQIGFLLDHGYEREEEILIVYKEVYIFEGTLLEYAKEFISENSPDIISDDWIDCKFAKELETSGDCVELETDVWVVNALNF